MRTGALWPCGSFYCSSCIYCTPAGEAGNSLLCMTSLCSEPQCTCLRCNLQIEKEMLTTAKNWKRRTLVHLYIIPNVNSAVETKSMIPLALIVNFIRRKSMWLGNRPIRGPIALLFFD